MKSADTISALTELEERKKRMKVVGRGKGKTEKKFESITDEETSIIIVHFFFKVLLTLPSNSTGARMKIKSR